jgi:glycolate oxidase FAD binding subunit
VSNDLTARLQADVRDAIQSATPLSLQGHGSKAFLGRTVEGTPLGLADHAGVLSYQPDELVLTARAGTTLVEIESVLAERDQMLPFEPPHYAASADASGATLGGTIACGLSGPARPYWGSARDLVLGVRVLTGRGEVLRFGGEVMKNVAGYDISRLMTGAFGTLGILLDVSLKVLPRPRVTRTLVHACDEAEAIRRMVGWAGQPLPISATCFHEGRLWVRVSGNQAGVAAAVDRLGGDEVDPIEAQPLWRDQIREQRHPFFDGGMPLWRLSVPPATPPLALDGPRMIEWGGAQRWLRSDVDAERIRAEVASTGGHATLFRGGDPDGMIFHPLPPALAALHRRLKQAFDPHGILNPGRLYASL